MSNQRKRNIDPLSTRSLFLELQVNGRQIGTATGFVLTFEGKFYLITNWHVVSGRKPDTNELMSPTGAVPDFIRIMHHTTKLGDWIISGEALYDTEGNPRWIEHPLGKEIDVVALPLRQLDNVQLYPFDLTLADVDVVAQPAMPVSIIGFPFGMSNFLWPIWKTGHVASDPDVDFDGRPIFLIDATTRSGMSGSPVVLRMSGGYFNSSGHYIVAGGTVTKFLGVYSGRIHGQAEIGKVWKPNVIREILSKANSV